VQERSRLLSSRAQLDHRLPAVDADRHADRCSGRLVDGVCADEADQGCPSLDALDQDDAAVGVLVPIYLIYRDFGLLDTRAGLVFILCLGNLRSSSGCSSPISGDSQGYPRSGPDGRSDDWTRTGLCADADGHSGLASTLLLNFILAWNEAFWTLNLSTLDAAPLTVFHRILFKSEGLFWAKLSAASTLAIARSSYSDGSAASARPRTDVRRRQIAKDQRSWAR